MIKLICGRGDFILKEKLKSFKGSLKDWNRLHFGNIHKKIARILKNVNELDKKEEEGGLSVEELEARKDMQEDFWRNVVFSESIYTQTKIMIQGRVCKKIFEGMSCLVNPYILKQKS